MCRTWSFINISTCRFHELATSGRPFTSEDYMLPTPSWAVFGAAEVRVCILLYCPGAYVFVHFGAAKACARASANKSHTSALCLHFL